MDNKLKEQIAQAAIDYAANNGLANDKGNGVNKLSKFTKINVSYLSSVMRFDFTFKNSTTGEISEIDDKWFVQLAEKIGFKIKKEYWPHVDTQQYKEINLEMREALSTSATRVLICESGAGKTYTVSKFKKENPARVFVVTCNRFDTLNDLIYKMMEAIDYRRDGSIGRKLSAINVKLYTMGRVDGKKPMLVFDEAENLTMRTFQMLKAMYDTINWSCSIVLIGTDQLMTILGNLKNKNKPGMPQFYRRFKAGIRYITPVDRSFKPFLEDKPFPERLKKTICSLCENYGELADFLAPAMREADMMGQPLTETLFRLKYNLPAV